MFKMPTLGALKRALTVSFGSICYGSLAITPFQLFRSLIRSTIGELSVFCGFIDIILDGVDGIVRYFNHYAFVNIAVYGKPFCEAGEEGWDLLKERGVIKIANDSLVSAALFMCTFTAGALTGGAALIIGLVAVEGDKYLVNEVAAAAIGCSLLGTVVMSIVCSVIRAGVSTMFVCLAEEPESIARDNPELYEKIQDAYPDIPLNN